MTEATPHDAAQAADRLAGQVGADPGTRLPPAPRTRTTKCIWYRNAEALTLVVDEASGRDADSALAVGLGERDRDQVLRLVLPAGRAEPTLHRWPWLADEFRDGGSPLLQVWTYAGGDVTPISPPGRAASQAALREQTGARSGLSADHRAWVEDLISWADGRPELREAHRPNVLVWKCSGQDVLRIEGSRRRGVRIVAGLRNNENTAANPPVNARLTDSELESYRGVVERACATRSGAAHSDRWAEHQLQSALKDDPSLLGLWDEPFERELPAWRPAHGTGRPAGRRSVGRGFIDLVGRDETTLHLVETKVGTDHLLVLQGLDYLIWADANRDLLAENFGFDDAEAMPIAIAYCSGAGAVKEQFWSRHTGGQLRALDPSIEWQCWEVRDWRTDQPAARSFGTRCVPT